MRHQQARLLDHIHLTVSDFERSWDFYSAVLVALGKGEEISSGRDWCEIDELYIDSCGPDAKPSHVHLCFQAPDRESVERFYSAGIQSGGQGNGTPGARDYHPGYYAAYLLDPDGNNIEAKFDERGSN